MKETSIYQQIEINLHMYGGKRTLLLKMVKMSGYNLTRTIDTASKPIAQVPPMVLQASTQHDGPSSDDPKGIGTHPMVI
jgi:hypothetical protein